jgi:endoglucanase
MDEVGFVVRHITDDGFLFLDSAQGGTRDRPERRFMVAQRAVVIGREGVVADGAIVAPSGHVLTPTALEESIDLSGFFLDVGVESRVEAESAGIHIGAPVIWESPTRLSGNRITSRAIDDRVGLAAIELALEWLDPADLGCELWVAATVMEENGFHGAKALAAAERFDAVLALDITLAGDTPVLDQTAVDSKLGAGPVVVHYDTLVAYDRDLAWALSDAAADADIPVQHGVFSNFGTDGVAFIDRGSPSVALGPPARYTHSANEMVDVRDVHATAALLVAYTSATHLD